MRPETRLLRLRFLAASLARRLEARLRFVTLGLLRQMYIALSRYPHTPEVVLHVTAPTHSSPQSVVDVHAGRQKPAGAVPAGSR